MYSRKSTYVNNNGKKLGSTDVTPMFFLYTMNNNGKKCFQTLKSAF